LPVRSQQNGNITNLHYNDMIGWSEGLMYIAIPTNSGEVGDLGCKKSVSVCNSVLSNSEVTTE